MSVTPEEMDFHRKAMNDFRDSREALKSAREYNRAMTFLEIQGTREDANLIDAYRDVYQSFEALGLAHRERGDAAIRKLEELREEEEANKS